MAAVGGVATFPGLAVNQAGPATRFRRPSGALNAATTGAITVTPTVASLVVTTEPPASVTAGSGFSRGCLGRERVGDHRFQTLPAA